MRRHPVPQRSAMAVLFGLGAACMSGCGGGVPVTLRVDQFTMRLDLNDMVETLAQNLRTSGVLPESSGGLPELWPDNLPPIQLRLPLLTPPVPVDLTPDPGSENAAQYDKINKAADRIRRIEFNRLVVRVDETSLTVALPQLALQIADKADAKAEDRLAWRTIGTLASTAPGFVGDNELSFVPSGESFINNQLADEEKEFAMRIRGALDINTGENPKLPSGIAALRMIIVATFFVEPL